MHLGRDFIALIILTASSKTFLSQNWFPFFFFVLWHFGSEEYHDRQYNVWGQHLTQMSTQWRRQMTTWYHNENDFDLADTLIGSQGPQGSIDLILRTTALEKRVPFYHWKHLWVNILHAETYMYQVFVSNCNGHPLLHKLENISLGISLFLWMDLMWDRFFKGS